MFIGAFSELVAVGNTKTLSWSGQTFFVRTLSHYTSSLHTDNHQCSFKYEYGVNHTDVFRTGRKGLMCL